MNTNIDRAQKNPGAVPRLRAAQSASRDPALIFRLLLRFERFDHDELAHGALVEELDAAADFREKSVVFAASYVEAGLYPRPSLAHDDSATWDYLSAECLEA